MELPIAVERADIGKVAKICGELLNCLIRRTSGSRSKKSYSDMARKVVIVAIKASKEVSKTAMVWALTHIVQPGDYVKLLAIIPLHPSSSLIGSFTRLTNECAGNSRTSSETLSDQREDIAQACSQMMLQLHDLYDPNNINIRIKIISEPTRGVVVAEAKRGQSNWVILDKHLKYERKCCMEELQCNVVVVKRSRSKILRLNLVDSPKIKHRDTWTSSPESEATPKSLRSYFEQSSVSRGPTESPMTATDVGTASMSSSELGTSSLLSGINGALHKDRRAIIEENCELKEFKSDSDCERLSPSTKTSHFHRWMENISTARGDISEEGTRKSVLFSRKAPLGPPPLCSICQHKAPVFGNPPRWFTFSELELATGGFSRANFLAEGGFGSVHRGVLPDGQAVAVKQYKLASSQGDREFCSEVEVLSCAQHRNVVLLIGFCVENGRRLLVYEYICNGSLDSHLYGRNGDPLEWSARQKIAVGAARGLRYLHEECRVGCIVHRDLRPNNILLTHDFEPLVGDFGLARWQPNGDMGVETRILGTFGYLAPEYAQSGQITEKADVYSFGVVLLELIAGRKAIDLNRPKGQQSLTEWARALLKRDVVDELVDPRLRHCYLNEEVHQMLQCASLCIRHDPYSRPRMSQVLRMLEGDVFV